MQIEVYNGKVDLFSMGFYTIKDKGNDHIVNGFKCFKTRSSVIDIVPNVPFSNSDITTFIFRRSESNFFSTQDFVKNESTIETVAVLRSVQASSDSIVLTGTLTPEMALYHLLNCKTVFIDKVAESVQLMESMDVLREIFVLSDGKVVRIAKPICISNIGVVNTELASSSRLVFDSSDGSLTFYSHTPFTGIISSI